MCFQFEMNSLTVINNNLITKHSYKEVNTLKNISLSNYIFIEICFQVFKNVELYC